MEDIEIEIKIPLHESEFERCRTFLENNTRLRQETEQTDDYYTPLQRNFLAPEFPFEWLSIRERSGKCILNYKHWYPENEPSSTHCDELEVEVSDPVKLHKILEALNLKRLVRVKKKRRIYEYGETIEIALDTVADLGHFIEVEYKGVASIEVANREISNFADILNLKIEKRDHRGYPYLLMDKEGLIRGNHES